MEWIYLIAAILSETTGTTLMKLSNGFSKLIYIPFIGVCYILTMFMFSLALKRIEMGMAYAVWSGIGIVLITTAGVILFKESFSFSKILFIGLIIIGTIGLNLVSRAH